MAYLHTILLDTEPATLPSFVNSAELINCHVCHIRYFLIAQRLAKNLRPEIRGLKMDYKEEGGKSNPMALLCYKEVDVKGILYFKFLQVNQDVKNMIKEIQEFNKK